MSTRRRTSPLILGRLVRLAEFPLILFEEDFALNELILHACRSHGITPKIAARSLQTELIFELVSAGVGIAFMPRSLVEQRYVPRDIPGLNPDVAELAPVPLVEDRVQSLLAHPE